MTSTYTTSSTFTRTQAKYLASKPAADLRQMQLFYGRPTDTVIDDYVVELIELLAGRYLDYVEYGFRRNGIWVVSLRYQAGWDGSLAVDDRPGRLPTNVDVANATWYSFLVKNSNWSNLSSAEQQRVLDAIPVKRSTAEASGYANGVWIEDRTYSSNGVSLSRRTFQPQ